MTAHTHPTLAAMDLASPMQPQPQPLEHTGKHKPEKRPNYNSGLLMAEYNSIGIREMAFKTTDYRSAPGGGVHGTDRDVHPTIWRWMDEPGIWREHSGKILPIESLSHVPGIEDELAQRRVLDDRERAAEMVRDAFKAGPAPAVIETRGDFELRKAPNGFEVYSHGVQVTPHAVPEQIARGILDTLAGAPEDPDTVPLDRVMAS